MRINRGKFNSIFPKPLGNTRGLRFGRSIRFYIDDGLRIHN